MNLSDLADSMLGTEQQSLLGGGPHSHSLYGFIRSETHTEPLIATIFWQTFITSPAFGRTLSEIGASPVAVIGGEKFVVQHSGRHDLMVFDPLFKGKPTKVASVKVSRDDFVAAGRRARLPIWTEPASGPLKGGHLEIAIEAMNAARFGLIVASQPELLYTAFVPHPPVEVCEPASTASASRLSTVGVIARDVGKNLGVTTALHAIKGLSSVTVNDVGTHYDGEVVSTDPITDSCFIRVPNLDTGNRQKAEGPLSGITPGKGETVHFEGMSSGRVSTRVIGWSPELPLVVPGSQLKLLTLPVTQQGDSGAALTNNDDKVLGFAFYRTGFQALIEFSAWVWAESVFMTHRLEWTE